MRGTGVEEKREAARGRREGNAWLEEIRGEIVGLAEEEYRLFQGKLLPEVRNYAGVRLPKLRRIARRIAEEDAKAYLDAALSRDPEEELFEEIMLQGMVIGYLREELPVILGCAERFVPKIDNWSVCDSFCSGLKCARDYPGEVWRWLLPYLHSKEEFGARFGVVMLLSYYVTDDYIGRIFEALGSVGHEGYYVKMAVAWALSVCYGRYPERTFSYLTDRDNGLDGFTFRKALQKITESKSVTAGEKDRVRRLLKENE